jgi:threonine dehydratase
VSDPAKFALQLDDFREVRARIAPHIKHTPLLTSRQLSERSGFDVRVKAEMFQRVGSYKIRGPLNKFALMPDDQKRRGVVCSSAGNHAQGVALAAKVHGIRAVVCMAANATPAKVAATRGYGAEVVSHGSIWDEANEKAKELVRTQGLTYVHPFDDEQLIAGQGTLGLEIIQDWPEVDAVVVPIGGGGLISGIATAAKGLKKDIRVFGAESKTYPSMSQRLSGQPIEVGGDTIAEGIAVKDVGDLAFGIVQRLVEDVMVVEEETIERAIVALIEIEKTVAEGAGAAALAALLEHPARFKGKRVGLPISGGNIDSRVLASVLMRGLVRDARLVRLRVTMPDVSGSLAKVAALIAEAGGNIVEIQHQRIFGTASVRSPEVEFLIETRDREHTGALVALLQKNGIKTLLS